LTETDIARLLEENGRPDLAESYRNGELAEQLRGQGRDDIAAQIDSRPGVEQPAEDPNEAFLQELKDAQNRGRVSLPGLLDE
jgi:hypothetical protein